MQNVKPIVVATVDPVVVTSAAPQSSDAIDMSLFHDVTFVLSLGDIAAETITATLQTDTTSAFSTPTTHGSADALAAHATNNDNKQRVYRIEARDVAERYLRLNVVTGSTSGGPMSAVAIATPRYSDAGELATVTRV